MSLFATGMTTGIVLECGDAVTYAVPVFEGFALPHATKRINVGGKHVTAHLIKMLQDRSKSSNVAESQAFASRIGCVYLYSCHIVGVPIEDFQTKIVKGMKETLCAVAESEEMVRKLICTSFHLRIHLMA